jgi:hypothetical protein
MTFIVGIFRNRNIPLNNKLCFENESHADQALLIFEAQVDFIDVRYREHTKW